MTFAGATQIGVPQAPGYVETWFPVYQVYRSTECYFCHRPIVRVYGIQKGGGRARCFVEPKLQLTRCVECQEEDGRAAGETNVNQEHSHECHPVHPARPDRAEQDESAPGPDEGRRSAA